jgi:hypothetical protein
MGTLLKWMGIALAVVVVVLGVLAGIGFAVGGKRQEARALRREQSREHAASKSDTPARAPSPAHAAAAAIPNTEELIARLDGLEAEGRHADAAVEAFNAAPSCSTAERTSLIAWLEERVSDERMPTMYWLARAHHFAGNRSEAAKWYAGASLTGRIDAARLADASAANAIAALEAHFGAIQKSLQDDAQLRRASIDWALEHEEHSVKERGVPVWIAAHGMAAFHGGAPALLAEDPWQAKRTEIRETWRKME